MTTKFGQRGIRNRLRRRRSTFFCAIGSCYSKDRREKVGQSRRLVCPSREKHNNVTKCCISEKIFQLANDSRYKKGQTDAKKKKVFHASAHVTQFWLDTIFPPPTFRCYAIYAGHYACTSYMNAYIPLLTRLGLRLFSSYRSL